MKEIRAKHSTPEQLRAQLTLLRSIWSTLREQLQAQLRPFAELRQKLQDVGGPTEPEHIGITRVLPVEAS